MILYDPPSGHRFGFPKEFKPLYNECLADTLRRDGYPEDLIKGGMDRYCRFLFDTDEELGIVRDVK